MVIIKGKIINKDVQYLIVPYDAMGSSAVLSSIKEDVKIIAVKNKTSLNVDYKKLNIKPYKIFNGYEECLTTILNLIQK